MLGFSLFLSEGDKHVLAIRYYSQNVKHIIVEIIYIYNTHVSRTASYNLRVPLVDSELFHTSTVQYDEISAPS